MKNIIYLFFVGLIVISCQQNDATDKVTASNDAISEAEKVVESNDSVEQSVKKREMEAPSFAIDSSTDESGIPRSTISLAFDGKKIEVTKAIGCEKIERKDYEQFQIPSNAVDACGGWWAGSGDYFYIVKNPDKNYYMVMKAVVDEQQEGNAYEYQSIMNITHKFK